MRYLFILCFVVLLNTLHAQQESSFVIQLEEGRTVLFSSQLKQNLKLKQDEYLLESIFPSLNIYKLSIRNTSIEKTIALQQIKKLRGLKAAEIDTKVTLRKNFPDDEFYFEQWDMDIIDAPKVWDLTTGGLTTQNDKIVVAVIDEGFDLDHEDMNGVIWKNEAEIPNNGIDDDDNDFVDDVFGPNLKLENGTHAFSSHGTSVTGIIGANGDNKIGVTGVNWNVEVMLLSGVKNVSDIVKGYNYILEQRSLYNDTNGEKGAFVVATNLSLGVKNAFPSDYPVWCSVYDALGKVGVLNAGATVNSDFNVDEVGDMPSTCPSDFLIAVTNSDKFDEKVANAGYGVTSIDLSAPGDGSFTIRAKNKYDAFGGASSSSPHVAGGIGLLYGMPCELFITLAKQNPSEMALKVKNAIMSGVDPLPSLDGITVSGGRLNIYNSMLILGEVCNGGVTGDLEIKNISVSQIGNTMNIEYETPDFSPYELLVYDAAGRLVLQATVNPPIFGPKIYTFDVSSFTKGVYFVALNNNEMSATESFSIIIN